MEIHIGSNSPVKHRIFWKGQIQDADALPTVDVYDITEDPAIDPSISPSEKLQTLTSVKSEIDQGTYEVYMPLSLTDRNRSFRFVWNYEIDGEEVSKEHVLYIRTPYVELAQAMDSLGIGTDPSDPNFKSYAELSEAEQYARRVIENYTGQRFYLYDDLHVVYGDDSDSLRLPFRLNTLHELYSNDILLLDTINDINNWGYTVQISESCFGIRLNRANMLDNTVYTANGMVPPSVNDFTGGAFSKGVSYRVQGRYGWPEVPDDVETACIELMRDYFSKDRTWRNKYLNSVQSFDWHFEYNTGAYIGTGNIYVDQLLLPYVLTQMVVI